MDITETFMKDMADLREQVMVNQFVVVAGCHTEQARQLLQSAKWHFEVLIFCFARAKFLFTKWR